MFFLFLFFSFINFCVVDYVVWWSIFVICTFVFVFFSKNLEMSYLINYYIIQEVCGYCFLLFDNWKMQFLVLMMKSGSSPFHFWLYSVILSFKKWFVLWFLVFQKLPYFFVLINFCGDLFFLFLFFGMIICYFQFFYLRCFVDMVVICSTESFNWLLLLGMFSFNEVFIFFFFYYFAMILLISYVYNSEVNFFSLEMLLVFLNIPMSITFFLKIFLFFGYFGINFYYFFLLLFLPFMAIGLGYLFFLVSMVGYNYGLKYYDYLIYVLLCVGLLCVF